MDGQRFDEITRVLASGVTRRNALRAIAAGIGGAALGLLGRGDADAALCRVGGQICRKPDDCCSGFCGPKDSRSRRRCDVCPNDGEPCGTETCCTGESSCLNGACCDNPCGEGPGAVCCASGEACIATSIDNEPTVFTCCAEEKACDDFQICCGDGESCIDSGTCCPTESICDGDECCLDGAVCIDGNCCPAAQACVIESEDVCCEEGLQCCDGACVDLDFDSNNCGTCGNFCGWYNEGEEIPFACCSGTCSTESNGCG